jgi:hypothetical protein
LFVTHIGEIRECATKILGEPEFRQSVTHYAFHANWLRFSHSGA